MHRLEYATKRQPTLAYNSWERYPLLLARKPRGRCVPFFMGLPTPPSPPSLELSMLYTTTPLSTKSRAFFITLRPNYSHLTSLLAPPPLSLPPLHLRFKTFTSIPHFKYQTFRPSVLRRTPKYLSSLEKRKKQMSRVAAVELDFFAMGKENKASPSKSKFLNRQRSFRGLFSVPWGFFFFIMIPLCCSSVYGLKLIFAISFWVL